MTGRSHNVHEVLSRIPTGAFVLTAAHEDLRTGVLVQWVQQCSIDPPMIMVAIPMGQPVEPLIRDSRSFAMCQIAADDQFLIRKFAAAPERGDDPFVSIDTLTGHSGAPIIQRAMSYLDCELVRKLDLESDHRLFVGRVHEACLLNDSDPAIRFGLNGAH